MMILWQSEILTADIYIKFGLLLLAGLVVVVLAVLYVISRVQQQASQLAERLTARQKETIEQLEKDIEQEKLKSNSSETENRTLREAVSQLGSELKIQKEIHIQDFLKERDFVKAERESHEDRKIELELVRAEIRRYQKRFDENKS